MAYVEASVRRGQIVSAARAVLVRDGVGRTTLRAVATEAGNPPEHLSSRAARWWSSRPASGSVAARAAGS